MCVRSIGLVKRIILMLGTSRMSVICSLSFSSFVQLVSLGYCIVFVQRERSGYAWPGLCLWHRYHFCKMASKHSCSFCCLHCQNEKRFHWIVSRCKHPTGYRTKKQVYYWLPHIRKYGFPSSYCFHVYAITSTY